MNEKNANKIANICVMTAWLINTAKRKWRNKILASLKNVYKQIFYGASCMLFCSGDGGREGDLEVNVDEIFQK